MRCFDCYLLSFLIFEFIAREDGGLVSLVIVLLNFPVFRIFVIFRFLFAFFEVRMCACACEYMCVRARNLRARPNTGRRN